MAEEEFHMVDLAATEGYLVDDSDEDDPVPVSYTHLTLPTNREV